MPAPHHPPHPPLPLPHLPLTLNNSEPSNPTTLPPPKTPALHKQPSTIPPPVAPSPSVTSSVSTSPNSLTTLHCTSRPQITIHSQRVGVYPLLHLPATPSSLTYCQFRLFSFASTASNYSLVFGYVAYTI